MILSVSLLEAIQNALDEMYLMRSEYKEIYARVHQDGSMQARHDNVHAKQILQLRRKS